MEFSARREQEKELKNAPGVRALPPDGDHLGRAVYWGHECATSLRAVVDGTSTNMQLDADHAWRCAKIAAYHWTRWRGYRAEMF